MRRVIAACLCALVGLGGVFLGGAPAGAGPCPSFPDADGRIKEAGGSYSGDGTYDDPAILHSLDPGESQEWVVRYRNRKLNAKTIELTAQLSGSSGAVHVKFFVGGTRLDSTALYGDGVEFSGIAPSGSTPSLTVRIKFRQNTNPALEVHVAILGAYTKGQSCGPDTMAVQIKPA